ncbi:hypothetical protein BDV27DRAFT_27888 [Aspergillus caelatus]|uniref:Uncharacterized protein n=1 Tax=Aspergillus caelatus TaxID=61420 RepID=A0A5N7AGW1_9EURO|nr:uncharacterized protein BDV27DRAFT_27888 [Aspergillus caelatus]KAE8368955.1 hypothetical protein BDV27DRAFT_27888 [Aspergillus caelatus]
MSQTSCVRPVCSRLADVRSFNDPLPSLRVLISRRASWAKAWLATTAEKREDWLHRLHCIRMRNDFFAGAWYYSLPVIAANDLNHTLYGLDRHAIPLIMPPGY